MKSQSEKLNLIITYEAQEYEPIECNSGDTIEKILKEFASKQNLGISSFKELYGGNYYVGENLKKLFSEIINSFDIKEKRMSILLYENDLIATRDLNDIIINLKIEPDKVISLQGKRDEKIKDIIKRGAIKIDMNINYFVFKYQNIGIDLNKKFDEIANSRDKIALEMTLNAYKKNLLIVNIIYNNQNQFRQVCNAEDNIRMIFNIYCYRYKKNINELSFKYRHMDINLDQTFDMLISNIDDNMSRVDIMEKNVYLKEDLNTIKEIKILVTDNIPFIKKYKYYIIILAIIIVVIIIIIIVFSRNQVSKNLDDKNDNNVDIIKETEKFDDTTKETDKSIDTTKETDKHIDTTKETDKSIDTKKETDKSIDTIKETDKHIDTTKETDKHIDTTKETDKSIDTKKETDKSIDTIKETDKHIDTTKQIIQTTIPIKSCNQGYFIPDDDETKQNCMKCSLEGCIKCNGTYEYNECTNCGNLIAVYENNTIIKCNNTCETGPEEQCLTCYQDKIECSSCNIGYKLVDGKCKPDFLIKAIYKVKAEGDTIQLFNSFGATSINQMIIDDKKFTTIKNEYQFQEAGNHTLYLKFEKTEDNSKPSYERLFMDNKNIISAYFSDFNEYNSNIDFSNLFLRCTNLISVDMSKLSRDLKRELTNMFNGCINLQYVNFDFKPYTIKVISSVGFMFHNCKSLTSIDLSNFDVSSVTSFYKMFSSCTSLRTINISNFKLSSGIIDNMFSNCYSLTYIDLSSFQPFKLTSMKSVFYNCFSLTSINLYRLYTSKVTNMEFLFFNCSSLKYIDISSFNTENVENIESMFEYCINLTSINFGNNFNTQKVTSIGALFSHCHSLESMQYPIIAKKINNLTSVFSDCYSLTSVNLQNFNTTNTLHFNYMFNNCYSLKTIDISHFNIVYNSYLNNMFSGCYSLTSVYFANITADIRTFFNQVFFDCPNLTFVNFPFSLKHDSLCYLFNSNISSNGTLILNKRYKEQLDQCILPDWTLYFS